MKLTEDRVFHPHGAEKAASLSGMPLASFKRRALAFILDLGVVLFLFLVWNVPEIIHQFRTNKESQPVAIPFDPFHSFGGLVALVAYFGLVTYLGNGATPGKRFMKIRVVSLTHDRMTLWQSIERALGYGASALEFGFGFLQYFFHANRQTVHDRIAETIVVARDSGKAQPPG